MILAEIFRKYVKLLFKQYESLPFLSTVLVAIKHFSGGDIVFTPLHALYAE